MALYLGDKKIAGSGSGSNVQVSAVVTEGTHIASIYVDNVEKKLYAPVSEIDDYATLTGDNDFTGKNTFAAVSAANDFSEETGSLKDKSLIMTDETGSYNVSYSQLCQQLYPIGSIYTTINANFDPNTSFGGTWQKIASGKCLFGADNIHLAGNEIQAGLPNVQAQVSINNLSTSIGGSHSHKILKADLTVGSIVDPGKGLGISQTKVDSSVYNGHVHTINGTGTITIENTGLYGMSDTVQPPAIAVIFWQRTA